MNTSFQLDKLHQECIQHPTPLLKLLATWSRNSRFFALFLHTMPDAPNLPVLHHVYACLQNPDVANSVVSMVTDMTENLLHLEDYEGKVSALVCNQR